MNRFAWDFRRDPIPGVPNVFVNGGYGGASVAPGNYKIRLTADGEVVETEAVVLPDPRLKVSMDDFAQQQQLLTQIDDVLLDIHHNVNRMRKVKGQVKAFNKSLKDTPNADTLIQVGKGIMENITNWEENLIQPNQKTFQDVINFPNQLNSHFLNLKSKIDTHDPRPTAGVKLRLKELLVEWEEHKTTLDRIINQDVKAFNDLYHTLKIPVLVIPKED